MNTATMKKGLGIMEKARTYFMINLQTITDPSVSHIASMLITGKQHGHRRGNPEVPPV